MNNLVEILKGQLKTTRKRLTGAILTGIVTSAITIPLLETVHLSYVCDVSSRSMFLDGQSRNEEESKKHIEQALKRYGNNPAFFDGSTFIGVNEEFFTSDNNFDKQAEYDRFSGNIYLCSDLNIRSDDIRHEIGHRIYREILTPEQRTRWEQFSQRYLTDILDSIDKNLSCREDIQLASIIWNLCDLPTNTDWYKAAREDGADPSETFAKIYNDYLKKEESIDMIKAEAPVLYAFKIKSYDMMEEMLSNQPRNDSPKIRFMFAGDNFMELYLRNLHQLPRFISN